MDMALVDKEMFFDRDMDAAWSAGLAGGRVVVLSRRCPDHEGPNEDAAGVFDLGAGCGVLVVADGMGGGKAGEQASQLAVHAVGEAVAAAGEDDSALRIAIMDGIDRANNQINALGVGAATTLSAVEICHHTVRHYHAGDSVVLIVGQRGRIKLQSVAHSPVGFALEAGHIEEMEAMHHADRHVVSNMLGGNGMRVEVGSPLKLSARDTLLLATDGLSDNLTMAEIIELLRVGPLVEAVERLAEAARRRMSEAREGVPSKPDDLTIIAYRPQS